MTKTACPSDQILRQYVLGDCSDDLSDDVERHVAACPECETTIAQFDTADDTLLRHLPLAAAANRDVPPAGGWIDLLRWHIPAAGQSDVSKEIAEPAAPLADGFANYDVLGELGRGGMGVVFLARHKQLHRRVALKVVRPEALSSFAARRRFQREIQILGGLHHPGIVMATDAGIVGRGAYLVMEWIDGVDFGRLVRDGGPLTIETACEAGRQIAEALAAAHKSGVVHRDVKPSNTMVDTAGRVRLLDFGLAHMTRVVQDSGDTSVGRLLGTLDYMAPEQAAGEGQIDARADLYGLGAMLFFLLTGQPPHGARTGRPVLEHIRMISLETAPLVSTLRADVPAELDQLIARLLSRDPAERPESAAEVASLLGRWAGGDLSARVIEFQTHSSNAAVNSADSAAARQSLAELLGSDVSPVAATAKTAPPARRGLRRWLALLGSLAAMACAGVVLWITTDKGTLKIESEVGGIAVEVVDEKDRVRELTIKEGENGTTLHTGQYRIRIAGKHNGLELDRDAIILRRGEGVLARITRQAKAEPAAATEKFLDSEVKQERLYQGRSESDWKRQFELETEPLAKIDAANALLSLGSALPPAKLLERILDVEEELVRANYDDPLAEYAFQNGAGSPLKSMAGGMVGMGGMALGGNDSNRVNRFGQSLNDQLMKIPPEEKATGLSQALLKGNDARAAFASALLRQPSWRPVESDIKSNPSAVQTILTTLDVPLQGFDRSALCQLIRMRYISSAKDATVEQHGSVIAAWHQLATLVLKIPAQEIQQQTWRTQIQNDLLMIARTVYRLEPSADFRELAARLVLSEITEKPDALLSRFPLEVSRGMGGMGSMAGPARHGMGFGMGRPGMPGPAGVPTVPIYNQERVVAVRQFMDYFLDAWVSVANDYLEQHRETPTDQGVKSIVQTLDAVLPLYSDGDDWPVEKTAELLTGILRTYYVEDPGEIVDQDIDQQLPAIPAMLLAQIVRITGRVPDFVRKGYPRSKRVVANLDQMKVWLANPDHETQGDFHKYGKGLLIAAPYETIKLVCELELDKKPVSFLFTPDGQFHLTTDGILKALAAAEKEIIPPDSASPLDPLLMLAILADLTGKSEEQDVGIANLVKYERQGNTYRGLLKELLNSSLRSRKFALDALQKMAKDSKSKELTAALRELLPDAAEPAAVPEPERLYQGRSESEWKRQFGLETEPVSKLNAANALLSLASALPPAKQLERILDVGEGVVRASFGEPEIEFALEGGSNVPTNARKWRLNESGPLYNAYGDFQKKLIEQVRRLPPTVLADVLSRELSQGSDPRAAFAGSLLSYAVGTAIAQSPEATETILTKLNVPLTGADRSALCQVLRLQYARKATGDQRGELLAMLRQLAGVLQVAPQSLWRDQMIIRLLHNAQELHGGDWTPELSSDCAHLAFNYLLQDRGRLGWAFTLDIGVPGSPHPYGKDYILSLREHNRHLLDAWVNVVNEHLEARRGERLDFSANNVIQSLDTALRIYSGGDDWPVEKTAELLAGILQTFYVEDPAQTVDEEIHKLLPATPAMLLTQIVRSTGRVPDFVRTGQPRSEPVAKNLKRLELLLNKPYSTLTDNFPEYAKGLLVTAPYETIKLICEADLPTKPGGILRIRDGSYPMSTNGVLAALADQNQVGGYFPKGATFPLDPLVMLTILADLTGKSADQDAGIANLLKYENEHSKYRGLLKELLNSSLKSRKFAQDALHKMAKDSQSEELTAAIRELVPDVAEPEK